MWKDLIKKRIVPFVGEEPVFPSASPSGSNPFSGVTIDQSGAPVVLPRILPPEAVAPEQAMPAQPVQPVSNVYPVTPEVQPTPPAIYPVPRSASTQEEINAIRDKDYSKAVMDEQGNVVKPAGVNRDKKWSTLEKIGNAAMGFLVGAGQGGLGGGIVEGVRGATDRNYNEKLADKRQLAELYPRQKQEQQQEVFQATQQARQAQTNDILRRPEKEKQEREAKFEMEAQKQLGRIQVLKEKEAAEGKKWTLITKNGKFVKKYPDHEEPLIDPTTGQQEENLIEKPEEITVQDGVNPDGTPRYRKMYMKGGQYANLKSNEAYRDAVLGLSRERLEETKKQNAFRNKLDVEKFTQAKKEFETVSNQRAQAFAAVQEARAKGDAQAAARFQLDLDKFDATLESMRQRALKAKDDGELDDAQFGELDGFVNRKQQ
jgi:hypothetical protein